MNAPPFLSLMWYLAAWRMKSVRAGLSATSYLGTISTVPSFLGRPHFPTLIIAAHTRSMSVDPFRASFSYQLTVGAGLDAVGAGGAGCVRGSSTGGRWGVGLGFWETRPGGFLIMAVTLSSIDATLCAIEARVSF